MHHHYYSSLIIIVLSCLMDLIYARAGYLALLDNNMHAHSAGNGKNARAHNTHRAQRQFY
jgi:hypothetical protein